MKKSEHLLKDAEQGDSESQLLLAIDYSLSGEPEKLEDALIWFLESATQGNAVAQKYVGDCFYFGAGVEEDENEAFKWYERSAQSGYSKGEIAVGDVYFGGYCVDYNREEAFKWYQKSALQDDPEAQLKLGQCYLNDLVLRKTSVRP